MGVMASKCAGKSEEMEVRAADAYDDVADSAGGCGGFAVCG